jgi:hypothetical protein
MSEEKKQNIQSLPQGRKVEGSFHGAPIKVKRVIPPPMPSPKTPKKK